MVPESLPPQTESVQHTPESLLREELGRASDRPQDLEDALKNWLDSNKPEIDNDDFYKIVSDRCSSGDFLGAAMEFVDAEPAVSISKSAPRTLRDERKKLAAALSEGKLLLKSAPSPVYGLGSAAHAIMEGLFLARGDISSLLDKDLELKTDESGQVTGFKILNARSSYFNGKSKLEKVGLSASQQMYFTEKNLEVTQPEALEVNIDFEVALPGRKMNESIADWARGVFTSSMETITRTVGSLPSKPYDVDTTFGNVETRKALMQIIGACHAVFGFHGGLSLVEWQKEQVGLIGSEGADEFSILNWLAIANRSLELAGSMETDEIGTLAELSEGNFRVKNNNNGNGEGQGELVVSADRIDVLSFKWGKKREGDDSLKLGTFSTLMQGRFNSQETRFRRKRLVGGQLKEVATKLPRTTRSLFMGMYKFFGERIFSDLDLVVRDFKFVGGDGGWATQFHPEEPLIGKHQEQMSGYLFKLVTQLAWVRKWSENLRSNSGLRIINPNLVADDTFTSLIDGLDFDDLVISLDEVIKFARESNVLERISGVICYELPSKEIQTKISLFGLDDEKLLELGERVFGFDGNRIEMSSKIRVLRALGKIFKDRLSEVELKQKDVPQLPESVSGFCFDFRGQFYLSIEDLIKLVGEAKLKNSITVDNAVSVREKNIQVFWIDGLIPAEGRLRIAVDNNAKFVILGLKEGLVRGTLVTDRSWRGVKQKTIDLLNKFEEHFWHALRDRWNLVSDITVTQGIINGDKILYPDGKWYPLVPGKPLICSYDLMTGKWFIDMDKLDEVIISDASRYDPFGIHRLRALIDSGRGEESIFCPLPAHDNRRTPAAAYYKDHITCFGDCGTTIEISTPKNKTRVEQLPLASGDKTSDFKSVSRDRQKTFEVAMRVGQLIAGSTEAPRLYIEEMRGLSVDDIGIFGYIPHDFEDSLNNLLRTETYKEGARKIKRKAELPFDSLASLAGIVDTDDKDVFLQNLSRTISETLDRLGSRGARDEVVKLLNLKQLEDMRMRLILEPGRGDGVNKNRWSGRINLPTYWLSQKKEGSQALVQSNFNGRGIVINNESLFTGLPHHKAPIIGGAVIKNGVRLRKTPTGFWFRDPADFLLNVDDTVVVFEGVFNAATFGRMRPDLRSISITNVGLGYHELIALLRWLGVKGDDEVQEGGMHKQLRSVILGFDFDGPGAKSYFKKSETLRVEFPGLEVRPIHEVLPPDVVSLVPAYDVKLFEKGQAMDGFALDLNDFIKEHDDSWAGNNGINNELAVRIKEVGKKYRYTR
jgi:hypothetical protein